MARLVLLAGVSLLLGTPAVAQVRRQSPAGSNPTSECGYSPDGEPAQIGPGRRVAGRYTFHYVSDYESKEKTFRRKICNRSPMAVYFTWDAAELNGWCKPGEALESDTPHAKPPTVAKGRLHYDLQSVSTESYKFERSGWLSSFSERLVSRLKGFVKTKAGEFRRVILEVTASWAKGTYQFSVRSDGDSAVEVSWPTLAQVLRDDGQEIVYRQALAAMVKQGTLRGGDSDSIVLNAGKQAAWLFPSKGAPRIRYLRLAIRPPGEGEAPLEALVAVYLPE